MNLIDILEYVKDKKRFSELKGFISFSANYLEYTDNHLQARIISQNENHYQFFQYDHWGSYQISRPINMNLFYSASEFANNKIAFEKLLKNIRKPNYNNPDNREIIKRFIYTIQQSIGAALDALRPGESNKARKINGDLFELFIRLIIKEIGIDCNSGIIQVPVVVEGDHLFNMSYQHDLIIKRDDEIKVLGTIKTSSKDRLDKIFIDKFLYSKLTETNVPHIAIILNDVQRKNHKRENEYGINATFLPGHFKGYTLKLNPLDGVYYCDIRPNMTIDNILNTNIKTIDNLFFEDIWKLI
ncbi:MAG TPA: hypothetical protein DCQ58_03310 [Saprospirales bacterium]|nr:hypothetical protein [Saprospirales bacterium]